MTGWDGTNRTLPAINVYKNTAQNLTSNTTTLIAMNVVRANTGGMVLNAGGSITVPRSGWYQVNANVTFFSSAVTNRRIVFIGYGASPGTFSYVAASILASPANTASISALSTSTALEMTAGQQVGVSANVLNTAWGLDVSQPYMNHLSVAYLGPS